MLKKLALNKTKEYEKHIALEEISKMLVNFAKGLPHYLSIGAEQGNIDTWDDLVINNMEDNYIYVQVKRQTTPFSTDAIIRDSYNKNKRKGQLKDLSVLDETFNSLAEITKTDKHRFNIFWLILPESSIVIKDGLKIRDLRNFKESIKSVTTVDNLKNKSEIDEATKNIYYWLTTWCNFTDWKHIIKAFEILEIKTQEFESDIKNRAKEKLSEIFIQSEVEKVYALILSYIDENSTYAGAIKPRQLLNELQEYMLPNFERWSLFQTDGSTWNISGTHDLDKNDEIEKPCVIVPIIWNNSKTSIHSLKICGDYRDECKIASSLMRLSLHSQGAFNTYCSDKTKWENSIKNKTGSTLGISDNDFFSLSVLNVLDNPYIVSESKELKLIDEKENYAIELNEEMYKLTFNNIDTNICDKINNMNRSVLRTEIEKCWGEWKLQLKDSIKNQKELFAKILHPNAEGQSISGEIRVGLKTVYLLSDAIFMLLVISVCLRDGKNRDWKAATDNLRMTAIGLAYWSGPSDSSNHIIEIDDDTAIGKLLENEVEEIVILSKSNSSALELLEDDIACSSSSGGLLTDPRQPKLLITNDLKFKKLVKSGDVLALTKHLKDKLDVYNHNIESSINNVVGGVL